jgi:hypothetical protein
MTGATIWQLSLLPDWRHMLLGGPGSHNTVSGLVLFAPPAWLALPKETLPSCPGLRAIRPGSPRAHPAA